MAGKLSDIPLMSPSDLKRLSELGKTQQMVDLLKKMQDQKAGIKRRK